MTIQGMMGQMSAGLGVAQVEARMRHLEQMIQSVQQRGALPQTAATGAVSATAKSTFAQQLQKVASTQPQARGKSAFAGLIQQLSNKHGVDHKLVSALIQQESGFNPEATSAAGAQGLMQLMPATAKSLGVADPLDAAQNIDGGIRYLKSKLDQYHGNIPLALASYNAGSGAVAKYGGIPPFKETQNYVRKVLSNYLTQ